VAKVDKKDKHILWFNEIGIEDVPIVGGKNASLGEMYQELGSKGVKVPNGFTVTASAYRHFLKEAKLEFAIRNALHGLNIKNVTDLGERGRKVRDLILRAKIPDSLSKEIALAYKRLGNGKQISVAVRSSATAEDLPDASFAGQQETFLNIRGEHDLIDACKRCFASLFTNRAISYRVQHKYDHMKVALSIGIQHMVRSDLACAGVMFTIDTETGFPNAIFVTGSYGLGENVVQGAVNPDEWYVFKPALQQGYKSLLQKKIGEKETKIIYAEEGTREQIKKVDTPKNEQEEFCLKDDEVIQLAKWGSIIEHHYSQKKKFWSPMDIEWAKDGKTGELFIVQARPETVQSRRNRAVMDNYKLTKTGKIICKGKSVGNKIGNGRANIIRDAKNISKFKAGDVLVTEMTDPDWVPIMRIASAIVTDKGGRTCHAAIVSRELGIPCVVGCNDATQKITSGKEITVDCANGEDGLVYEGKLPFTIHRVNVGKIPHTKTHVMVNIGNPEEAFELSFLPVDGVGLAREEFIINEYIKIHPMALLHYNKMDADVKSQIDELTKGYKDKKEFFIDKLAQGVSMIAAAFWPHDVIVRLSDFKTNEYANLIGGASFEPKEANPMLGWRGANRYYTGYKDAFALECLALKKVREKIGLKNLKIMIPMCRTPEEGKKVISEMAKHGLKQGKDKLEVYCMCELPANVVLMDEFSKIFDGFSIGSNDLTQMIVGVDRDSALVSHITDERNPAVLQMMEFAIRKAKANKRKIGICGDAPSTYPQIARFLVNCGIDSISLSPDAVVRTKLLIAEYEKHHKK